MKTIIKFLSVTLIVLTTYTLQAQTPPPPNNSDGTSQTPGEGGNTPVGDGGGAPIGSGLVIVLALGAAYGGAKIWKMKE